MPRRLKLRPVAAKVVHPRPPYNFDLSVHNPSYYPTPTGFWEPGQAWFTVRWKNTPVGIRFRNKGSVEDPAVNMAVYAQQFDTSELDELIAEIGYRFSWYEDYTELYRLAKQDDLLRDVVRRMRGLRGFCAESLYDLLMITILLQNAPVRRTETMTRTMLDRYGELLEFDRRRYYCFWPPDRLLRAGESELRSLKVGYRAKSFIRASEDCLRLDEEELRTLDDEALREGLLGIYGVGPASVDYLTQGAFHRKGALNTVPPWETKIFSRILFKRMKTTPQRVLDELKKRYGMWRGIAAHYLFMDLCWRHKKKPIAWFGELMPY